MCLVEETGLLGTLTANSLVTEAEHCRAWTKAHMLHMSCVLMVEQFAPMALPGPG